MPRRRVQPEYDKEACVRLASAVINHALSHAVHPLQIYHHGYNLINFSRSIFIEHAAAALNIDATIIREKIYDRGMWFLSQPDPRKREKTNLVIHPSY